MRTEEPAKNGRGRKSSRLSEGSVVRSLDYAITYPGKTSVESILHGSKASPVRRLSIGSETEKTWRNRLYGGENIDVLRALLDDPAVRGKVTLVYIDPPYATGASFESRTAVHAYEDVTQGSDYLEFIRQRLVLLRELLAPDGSIYVHLGKMAFPVKVIMDEVFGPLNFRNWITRKKSNRKNFTRKQFGNFADYILFYSRNGDYVWNRQYEKWTDDWMKTEYPCVEEETGRRYKKVPVHAPGLRNGETGKPWRGKLPPPGKHWQYPPSKLDEMDARGEIYWSPNGNPRRKIYHETSEGVPVQDIWMEFRDAHNQNVEITGYPTEKNLDLLRRIVAASSNPGDIVLDCFCGSGTTLVAAEESERRWIGIDSSTTAIETTLKRLGNGSEKMGDFVGKRGKSAKQEPSLFDSSLLRSAVDVYTADGMLPKSPDKASIAKWASLFKWCQASIVG